jgi:hypothetical protein
MPVFGLYLITVALWPPFRELHVARIRHRRTGADASVMGVMRY